MGLLHRRAPLYARPWPLLAGSLVAALGLGSGLGWSWDWSLQTGNVFLLLRMPSSVARGEPGHLLALAMGLAGGLGAARFGLRTRAGLERDLAQDLKGWRRARFRFYPNTLLFGLFLLAFGCAFLFDASLYADQAPGGYAAFVYLDYAGLFDRPVMTGIGVVVMSLGFACATTLAVKAGLGTEPTVRASTPAPATQARVPPLPTPAPIAPRTARSALGVRQAGTPLPPSSPLHAAGAMLQGARRGPPN